MVLGRVKILILNFMVLRDVFKFCLGSLVNDKEIYLDLGVRE